MPVVPLYLCPVFVCLCRLVLAMPPPPHLSIEVSNLVVVLVADQHSKQQHEGRKHEQEEGHESSEEGWESERSKGSGRHSTHASACEIMVCSTLSIATRKGML